MTDGQEAAGQGRRMAGNSLAWFVSENIAKAISLAVTVAVARAFGDVDFGTFSFALAFTGLFAILINWGLRTLVTWEIAKDRARAGTLVGNALAIQAALSVAAFALIAVFLSAMRADPDTARAAYIAAAAMIFQTLADTPEAAFQAFEKLAYNAALKIVRVVARAAVVLPLVFLGYGLFAVLWAYAAVMAFNFVLTLAVFSRTIGPLSVGGLPAHARRLFRDGFFFALKSGFVLIYFKIDVTMLQMMSTSASVGVYSSAYTLLEALITLPMAVSAALLPVAIGLVGNLSLLRKRIGQAGSALMALVLPVAAGGILLASPLMRLVFGTDFAEGSPALAVLLLTLPPLSMVYVLGVLEIAFRLERKSVWILAANCLVNIGLNLWLIPKYDLLGAALATVITELFYVAAYFRLVRGKVAVESWSWARKPLLASLAMAVPVLALKDAFIAIPVLVGALVYGIVLYAIRGISREQIQFMKSIVFRRPTESDGPD